MRSIYAFLPGTFLYPETHNISSRILIKTLSFLVMRMAGALGAAENSALHHQ
jgi:hypothetical protein